MNDLDIKREMTTCRHFNGVFINDTCRAGVNYHELLGSGPGCFKALPCLSKPDAISCARAEFRTREEAEREITDQDAQMVRFELAFRAAKANARENGLKQGNGGIGSLKCPNCADGKIRYSVASVNGHMHAACSTPHCVSWME